MAEYKLISADSHIVEPPDMYTGRIEPRFRDRPMGIRRDAEGLEYLEIAGRPSKMVRRNLPQGLGAMDLVGGIPAPPGRRCTKTTSSPRPTTASSSSTSTRRMNASSTSG